MADSSDEIIDDNYTNVDLGFAEKCELGDEVYLSSLFYPSKLGGRPAWLRWDLLPPASSLTCGKCEKQLVFLCQIYVPLDLSTSNSKNETKLFHRTLYLFCCRNGPCSKFNSFVKAFRTEKLQEDNEPDNNDLERDELIKQYKELDKLHSLCNLCGCLGDKTCSSCHLLKYCSKEHQTIDWKYRHKKECSENAVINQECRYTNQRNPLLFNEYEIVIEAEPTQVKNKDTSKNGIDYPIKALDPQLESELNRLNENDADKYFTNFRERIDLEPEQIIRYDLGGEPLWVSSENIPSDDDIPNCICGEKRQFEFQVLPQMINYLGVETTIDSIDWGTLCVYTCSKNCQDTTTYKEEFVWKQDFSNSDVIS